MGNYIFVNEYRSGVHVIDNTDPSAPEIVAFIEISGNVDMAVRGTTLYADSYVDLVAIDISDPFQATEVGRLTDVFPYYERFPSVDWEWSFNDVYADVDERKGIVTGWAETDRKVEFTWGGAVVYELVADGGATSGIGGSMARFTVVDDYLYALHDGFIDLFDISTPQSPAKWAKISLAWDIETVFPYENKLFIGSMTGMYIFDNSSPSNPTLLSEFTHATSCDPVVAAGDRAYVTLRSGTTCGGGVNQLDIIDIADLESPVLVATYSMWNPHGLGIDGTTLFVCDGSAGLKVFDASVDENLYPPLAWFTDIDTYDVIPYSGIAVVVGSGGLHLFDYTDLDDIYLTGTIPTD